MPHRLNGMTRGRGDEGMRLEISDDGDRVGVPLSLKARHITRNKVSSIVRDDASEVRAGSVLVPPPADVYQRLVQSITDYAIYMLDLDGRVVTWNAGAHRAKGYTTEEIVGRHFSCFYAGVERLKGAPMANLDVARLEGKYEGEGWRVRKDGSLFWAHVVIDALHDPHGHLFGYAKITRDCSAERRLTQQADETARRLLAKSQQQEQRFRALVEGVTDYAIYLLDLDGIVSNWNAGAQRAKQYEASEIVGQYFGCFYSEQDQLDGVPEAGLITARTTGKYNAEGWRVRKDGSRFWANVVIQPVYDDAGNLFGFAKITRDCTEQREAANALATTTQNLDLALDNMMQGLCLFDRRGKLVLSNKRFNDIFALPAEALRPGMRLSAFLRTVCDAQETISDAVREAAMSPPSLLQSAQLSSSPSLPPSSLLPSSVTPPQHLSPSTVLRQALHVPPAVLLSVPGQNAPVEFPYRDRHIAVSTRWLPHGEWLCTVEDVTEQRAAAKRIHHLAHHDALTGLPNRPAFQDRLREALVQTSDKGSGFALFYMDLDGFKSVNDTLGHLVGDALLQAVSARFSAVLKHDEHLARLGGDEFTIISTQCHSVDDARSLAYQCIQTLGKPFDLGGHQVRVGVSVGVVSQAFAAFDGGDVLQQADLALYKAKREGRHQYRFYECGMNDPRPYGQS